MSKTPAPPHLGTWLRQDGTQGHLRARGGEAKIRLGTQVRARIRHSPRVTRDIHDSKTGPREQVSPQIKDIHNQRGGTAAAELETKAPVTKLSSGRDRV